MKREVCVRTLTLTTEDTWFSSEIQRARMEDPDIRPILKRKLKSADLTSAQEIAQDSHATKRYWALRDTLHLKNGVEMISGRVMMEAHVHGN
ncbi:hypothetical protein AVEN_77552-1 [Araneus ventricosus]|uniref:Uncharacterized protein n=1 Tax=Araneus ventricosus TaxID=182803 RepID=A0A4Y2ICA3_ARAVE|nr:hypothetical protein AVEN_77552-1 [Araneus ventricosus]